MHAGVDTEDSVGAVSAKMLTRIICWIYNELQNVNKCNHWRQWNTDSKSCYHNKECCRWKQCHSYILSPVVVSTTAFHTPQVVWVCWSSKVVFTLATHSILSIQRSTQEIFKIDMFWKWVVQFCCATMIAVVRASSYYKPCRIIWHAKALQQICLSWHVIALHYTIQVTSTLTTAIITRYKP